MKETKDTSSSVSYTHLRAHETQRYRRPTGLFGHKLRFAKQPGKLHPQNRSFREIRQKRRGDYILESGRHAGAERYRAVLLDANRWNARECSWFDLKRVIYLKNSSSSTRKLSSNYQFGWYARTLFFTNLAFCFFHTRIPSSSRITPHPSLNILLK